ncbi:hypothetical protein ACIOKD_16635 [Streptomyces sp. NPDC087844]|uniref:hypothetical protein n=1 Tax=Streptomyces sp. NPDC087844 TaxID=3365805 RepID=UPI00381D88EE
MGGKKKPAIEPEEPSRAAGACVLVVLAGVVTAVVFAVSTDAGVIALWAVGLFALWRAARRMSDSSATPPPKEWRPSCKRCTGQELLSVTPSETQKGMMIYSYALTKRPGHTHLHIVEEVNET